MSTPRFSVVVPAHDEAEHLVATLGSLRRQTVAAPVEAIVVAGAGEDKPEVAACVAWSGCGVDLRTGRPPPRRIRRAEVLMLTAVHHREHTAHMRDRIAALGDPVDAFDASVRLLDRQA